MEGVCACLLISCFVFFCFVLMTRRQRHTNGRRRLQRLSLALDAGETDRRDWAFRGRGSDVSGRSSFHSFIHITHTSLPFIAIISSTLGSLPLPAIPFLAFILVEPTMAKQELFDRTMGPHIPGIKATTLIQRDRWDLRGREGMVGGEEAVEEVGWASARVICGTWPHPHPGRLCRLDAQTHPPPRSACLSRRLAAFRCS
ncbi:hypothetical protein DFH09DRAFT_186389 [Mycena vulgaris]|nr:hypothetical protein DFH09DRAFT_186389 [Mycena vulgaris]